MIPSGEQTNRYTMVYGTKWTPLSPSKHHPYNRPQTIAHLGIASAPAVGIACLLFVMVGLHAHLALPGFLQHLILQAHFRVPLLLRKAKQENGRPRERVQGSGLGSRMIYTEHSTKVLDLGSAGVHMGS